MEFWVFYMFTWRSLFGLDSLSLRARGMKSSLVACATLFCVVLALFLDLSSAGDVPVEDPKGKHPSADIDPGPPSSKRKAVPEGISPRALNMLRNADDTDLAPLTPQVLVEGAGFWFGTQMLSPDGKFAPAVPPDGARLREHVPKMQDFWMDIHSVTVRQFKSFVESTGYKTEAERFKWSFVLDIEANDKTKKEVDSTEGYGRVKNALHWMAAKGASWRRPRGALDKTAEKLQLLVHPVTHVSFNDAEEYCHWATGTTDELEELGMLPDTEKEGNGSDGKLGSTKRRILRLPTEWEYEFAARGGLLNQTFPWGDEPPSFGTGDYVNNINIWHEKDSHSKFPTENDLSADGYLGTAPAKSYAPNGYGIYNLVGNVWEWVLGGDEGTRTLRGGSYVDSLDARYNHAVSVATKQTNSADSAASNVGFRCVSGGKLNIIREQYFLKEREKRDIERDQRAAKRNAQHEAEREQWKDRQAERKRIQKELEDQVKQNSDDARQKKVEKEKAEAVKNSKTRPLHPDVLAEKKKKKKKKKEEQSQPKSASAANKKKKVEKDKDDDRQDEWGTEF